jgi:hypothetical protein
MEPAIVADVEPIAPAAPAPVAAAPEPEPLLAGTVDAGWDTDVEVDAVEPPAPALVSQAAPAESWDAAPPVTAPTPAAAWETPAAPPQAEEVFLEATVEPLEAELAPAEPEPAPLPPVPAPLPPAPLPPAPLPPAPAPAVPASSGSAFDLLAMPPESAPRIPTFARQAPPPPQPPAPAPVTGWEENPAPPAPPKRSEVFASSGWEESPAPPPPARRNEVFASSWEEEPAPPAAKPDASVFGSSWDNNEPDAALTGSPSDSVELATNSDFLTGVPVSESEDVSIDADPGDFVVENASAAALATNVRESGPSSIDDSKIELASNSDFIDNSQLTGTGNSWTDTRNSIPLEGEEEGEVIQGMVLEEEEPAPAEPADSWGVAVSQPSPVPRAVAPPPALVAPPPPALVAPPPPQPIAPPQQPPARVVPPLTAAPAPVQNRVAVPMPQSPVTASRQPVTVQAPQTSVTQSAVPMAGPGASAPNLTPVASAGNVTPVPVPGEHRVILHTVEGQVKRGAIKDAKLGDPTLVLQLANGGTEALPRERVKALFFMLAPGARAPSTEGNKVRVTFKDGRQVAGFSRDHKGATSGFFVVPADNRTNTERIFIFRHAVQSISVDS